MAYSSCLEGAGKKNFGQQDTMTCKEVSCDEEQDI